MMIIFEVRGLPARAGAKETDRYRGQSVGQVIECENGYLAGTTAYDKQGKEIKKFVSSGESHAENFIRAVRSRKPSDLNAEILKGIFAPWQTGRSYRLGKQCNPEEIHEAPKTDMKRAETLGSGNI
jgi:hypothetical protein